MAGLLFLLSLRPGRYSPLLAMAGVFILASAAIYPADIVNLPEALAVVLIGVAVGFLVGRDLPAHTLPSLMAATAGSVGFAAAAMALAMWLNPFALGLIAEGADHVSACDHILFGLTLLTGGMSCLFGVASFVRRDHALMLPAAASLAGWAVTGSAFLLDNAGMAVAGGLAGSAAIVLMMRQAIGRGGKGLPPTAPVPNAYTQQSGGG